ncbi:unnamed protein product, partial [Effrenium voratum]
QTKHGTCNPPVTGAACLCHVSVLDPGSHLAWWPQSKIPEASQQATSGGHPHAACGVLCGLRSEGCKGTRMCSPRVSLPSCTSAQGGQQSGAQRAFCSLGPRQKGWLRWPPSTKVLSPEV